MGFFNLVRTRDEFYNGHVENAINIPYILFTSTGKPIKFHVKFIGIIIMPFTKLQICPYAKFYLASGKVKNLKFVEQVMGVMKKDDYILVVIESNQISVKTVDLLCC